MNRTYSEEHLNKVIAYLGKQPYGEVAELIHILQACAIEPEKKAAKR